MFRLLLRRVSHDIVIHVWSFGRLKRSGSEGWLSVVSELRWYDGGGAQARTSNGVKVGDATLVDWRIPCDVLESAMSSVQLGFCPLSRFRS